MATVDIDVISQGLLLLGESTIASLTDGSEKAEVVSNIYPNMVLALQAEYPWRFTMKKVQLSQNVTAPENEWKYSYDMPSDSITGGVQELRETGDTAAPVVAEFEVYQQQLYTDLATAWLDYQIAIIEDLWPAHFLQFAIYACAAHFADPLTDEESKAERWWRVAFGRENEDRKGGYFRTARQVDARISGDYGQRLEQHDLISVR